MFAQLQHSATQALLWQQKKSHDHAFDKPYETAQVAFSATEGTLTVRNSKEAITYLKIPLHLTSVRFHPLDWLHPYLHLVHCHLCIWTIALPPSCLCSIVQVHLISLITASQHLIPYVCIHSCTSHLSVTIQSGYSHLPWSGTSPQHRSVQ